MSECRFLPLMQENMRECHVGAQRESDPVSVATDVGKHAGVIPSVATSPSDLASLVRGPSRAKVLGFLW